MEEDGSSEVEAALYLQNTSFQLFRHYKTRTLRTVLLTAVATLLFTSAAVALLAGLRGRGYESPDSQTMNQPSNYSPGTSNKQQRLAENPSSLLTAPNGNNTVGKYLTWESQEGNAHCRGGFIYSRGNLVVPREGIYRVFLQITYDRKSGKECLDNDELNLCISVGYIANSYPKSINLLEAADTVSCKLKAWIKTLYTAGLFVLEANSTLHVTSTHAELIVHKESQVFFGAELAQ